MIIVAKGATILLIVNFVIFDMILSWLAKANKMGGNMKQKISKMILSLSLLFGMQVASVGNILAKESTKASESTSYEVSTKLRKSDNISADSMAAGVLSDKAILTINEGQMFVTIEFLEGEIFGLSADVSSITYYEGDISNNVKKDPTTTLREGTQFIKTAIIPVSVNTNGTYGCYVQFKVDAMGASPDAYVEVLDVKAGIQDQLTSILTEAKKYTSDVYTEETYNALQTAIDEAQKASDNNEDEATLNTCVETLKTAIKNLVKVQVPVTLEDGTYNVPTNVLQADGSTSMAAQAIKGATLTVENGTITVDLKLGPVTMYGQTAYIEKMEFEKETITKATAQTTWEEATITKKDKDGNVTGMQFVLSKNVENTNVKFYYGGRPTGSQAVLYLGLNDATTTVPTNFEGDGTYRVDIALWNAKEDKASMAASAIDDSAIIIVKDGVAKMYISTKKMTFGTMVAYLQELKVKKGSSFEMASIYSKDSAGNPNIFAFDLPSEDEYLDVLVNPHVAMMGNADIEARLKVDYTSLDKVSDETTAPTITTPPASSNGATTGTVTPTVSAPNSVSTGDTTNVALMGGLLMLSGVAMFLYTRKRSCTK